MSLRRHYQHGDAALTAGSRTQPSGELCAPTRPIERHEKGPRQLDRQHGTRRDTVARAALLAPALALLSVIVLYPLAQGVLMSLSEMRLLERVGFVGLENYQDVLGSAKFWTNLRHSGVFVGGTVVGSMVVGLGLALVMNRPMRYRSLLRSLILVPWVLSQVVTAMLWLWIVDPRFGIFSWTLELVGLTPVALLADPKTAMATVVAANIWHHVPLAFLLLLAALQTVRQDLIEAARVDGARARHIFRFVTLPAIAPAAGVTAILLSVESFNMMALIYAMTGGGPTGGTTVVALDAFKQGFSYFDFPVASTMAMLMSFVNMLIAVFFIRTFRAG
jgi:multiple sugar transport system permease protein